MNGKSGRTWINFKELRERLRFEDVLRHYAIDVRRKGDQHQGPCPLPGHAGRKGAPSFSANLERGIFQCFGCGAKGNALEFACLMEGADLADGNAIRKVALKLRQTLLTEGEKKKPAGKIALPARPVAEPKGPAAVVNAPLDFELKHLEHVHPSLTGRGFEHRTAVHFGVGFCSRGFLKDRIAIPLHDHDGRLVGYAGMVADDGEVSEANPRHLFPSERVRGGVRHVFDRSLLLYNGHRIKEPCDDLIVVQDFDSVWWLRQNGFPSAVALMGPECSERQAEFIVSLVKTSGRVWILSTGGQDSENLVQPALLNLSLHRFIRWVKIERLHLLGLSYEKLNAHFQL